MCLIYDIYCTIYFIEVEIKHKIYPCAIYVKSVQYWGPVICFFELLSVIMFTLAFIYIRSLTWGRLLLFFFIIVVIIFFNPLGTILATDVSPSTPFQYPGEWSLMLKIWVHWYTCDYVLHWYPDICNLVISGYAPSISTF